MQPLIVRRIFPSLPQPGKHERRIVFHADRVRDFAAENFLPFVETITRNQATTLLERFSVRWCCIDGFDSCVYRLVRNFGIFRPVRDQPPLQSIQATSFCLRVEPDRKDFLARCDVVTDRDVRLLRYRDVVAPSQFFLCCSSPVTNFQSWISAFIARSATSLPTVSVQPGIFLVVIGFSN